MRQIRGSAPTLFVAMLLAARAAVAQQANVAGDARYGLPGVLRVPMQHLSAPRLTAAFDAGYGLTEAQSTESAHHRAIGSLGLGFAPLSWLEFGLLNGVRYDSHPNDGAGADSGTIGQVSQITRIGARFGTAFRLGSDLGVTFPGSERISTSLKSPAIDLRAIFGWIPQSGIRYAGFAGFRIDQTSGAGANAARYRAGDRLVLGLSDFNAVLLGVGVVAPVGKLELLGELTGDLLVGRGAPPILQSPLRVNLGVRYPVSRRLAAELMSECSLSARPAIVSDPPSPLVPVEPRVSIVLGLRYRLWGGPATEATPIRNSAPPELVQKVAAVPAPATPVLKEESAAPETGHATVTVYDSAGQPLSDASVTIVSDNAVTSLAFQNGSTFTTDSAPAGTARVKVSAELMRDWEREVKITKGQPLELRVEMLAAEISAQIRGLVRGFDGKNLPAQVQIEPGNHHAQVGPDGVFGIDVLPGKYRVRVFLNGYQPQERVVEVGKNGVTVLNIDLQKGR